MKIFIGTSGYSYDAWKEKFFPEKISAKKMLPFYAEKFRTVEMNYTFRQVPSAKAVEGWAQQVPDSFRFALKAPMAITHTKKLKNAAEVTEQFLTVAKLLQAKRGPILFQLPPNLKIDVERLVDFLKLLPDGTQAAFEFRHDSWFVDEVYAALREHGCALCAAHTGEGPSPPWIATTNWGYLRLRGEGYSAADLRKWLKQIRGETWDEVFVYFKHEDTGTGPQLATRLLELAEK